MATYKDSTKIESAETTDQKVRIVANNIAIETGTFRLKGTSKDGKPFDGKYGYTTTWTGRNGQWKIISDHTSEIKK